jgi:long-subunit acyl-CoA synthetase (AMP-forming)
MSPTHIDTSVAQLHAHPAIKAVIEAGIDLVTPTMKLKRKSIVATYATEIETLYS